MKDLLPQFRGSSVFDDEMRNTPKQVGLDAQILTLF
jgi:hypothetical protein